MWTRWTSAIALLAMAAVVPVGLTSPVAVEAAPTIVSLSAPEADATDFGAPFDLDVERAVAVGALDAQKVVYVFDLVASTGWIHTATIEPPNNATSAWATQVSVSGDTIIVTDPASLTADDENYGQIDVFEFVDGDWAQTQELRAPGRFVVFADDAWLSGDAIVVRDAVYCDGFCGYDVWHLYERNAVGNFARVYSQNRRVNSAGTDDGRLALAIGPAVDPFFLDCPIGDHGVTVVDAQPDPYALDQAAFYDEESPCPASPMMVVGSADLSGDLSVHELWRDPVRSVVIQRKVAGTYVDEASFPVSAGPGSVGVVPGAVVRAEVGSSTLAVWEFDGLTWAAGDDVDLPAPVSANSAPVVSAGSLVAARGDDDRVHIVEIDEPSRTATCLGQAFTVDLAVGESPTDGDDVVLGTPGADVIDALGGDDVVCSGGGADYVTGGDGSDVVLGGAAGDVVTEAETVGGEAGNDIIVGAEVTSLLDGGAGDDLIIGRNGDDIISGGSGNDALWGGFGSDSCYGGPGDDTARSCEVLRL